MLWQNGTDNVFPPSSDTTVKAVCNTNLGVWARFAYALNARTEWVAVFDDDTIPGPRWFENCLDTVRQSEGLLVTVGIRLHGPEGSYPLERYGWPRPVRKAMEVDYGGHAWFSRREWLSHFWRELPDASHDMLVGEDMHFSHMLRKYGGIPTYVPPHPPEDKSLWGSQPISAATIGTEEVALSRYRENLLKMSAYAQRLRDQGFVPIRQRPGFVEDEHPLRY